MKKQPMVVCVSITSHGPHVHERDLTNEPVNGDWIQNKFEPDDSHAPAYLKVIYSEPQGD